MLIFEDKKLQKINNKNQKQGINMAIINGINNLSKQKNVQQNPAHEQ
jgi:hypothetical protein